ncbi:MAG: hypothetical protein ABI190_01060 [Casimicrobiaceae bacterium]
MTVKPNGPYLPGKPNALKEHGRWRRLHCMQEKMVIFTNRMVPQDPPDLLPKVIAWYTAPMGEET